MHVLKTEQFYY